MLVQELLAKYPPSSPASAPVIASIEQKLKLFAALMNIIPAQQFFPYGGNVAVLAGMLFKCADWQKVIIPAGDYPLVCYGCGAVIGSCKTRAAILCDAMHCPKGSRITRQCLWHTGNSYIIAEQLNIPVAVLEHFLILEELQHPHLAYLNA